MKGLKVCSLWSVVFGLTVLYLSFPAQAWRINEELKQEIASKQAYVAAHPNDAYAHFDLAITYAYTNHIQEGWDELGKVIKIDPDFKPKGLNTYIRKVTANPSDWKLRFRLAFAYYFNGEKEDALRELENVLIIDPNNVWAYGYLALIYGEKGDYDTAMAKARAGLKIDSQVAALHLLLSEGYYKKNDSWRGFLERWEALRLRALGF